MSTTGPRRPRLGGAARPTGVKSCCPTGARASARRSPACRGEASRRHRSRSERRPGTRIHPRCDRPDVVGRPTLPVVRGDAHRGTKQRAVGWIGGWRLALAAMLVARSSTSAALRHPTRENRLVRRLGDFGGCLRQLGRLGARRRTATVTSFLSVSIEMTIHRLPERRMMAPRSGTIAVPLGRGSSNGRARSDPQRVDGRSTGARLGEVAAGRGSRGEPKGSSSPRVPRV